MFQANALAGIIGQICAMAPELAQQLVAKGVVLPGADFMAKSLEEQKPAQPAQPQYKNNNSLSVPSMEDSSSLLSRVPSTYSFNITFE